MVVVSVLRTMEIVRQARLSHPLKETPAEFADGGSSSLESQNLWNVSLY